jgi:hypothetical protein
MDRFAMMSLTHVSLGSSHGFGEHGPAGLVLVMRWIIAASIALLAGCPARNNVPCAEDGHCNLAAGGTCLAGPSSDSWCAYPDTTCPSGFRYSDFDVGDGVGGQCVGETPDAGVDAPPDALPDSAPGQARFDVAYVNVWDLGTGAADMSEVRWARIINTASEPLDLSTATFTNVSDNHNQIVIGMAMENNAGTSLNPGFSLGALTGGASSLIVSSGMVTEPDQSGGGSTGLIRITATNLPPAGTWLIVDGVGTLRIGNAFVSITVTIRSSGTGSAATPVEAKRSNSSSI